MVKGIDSGANNDSFDFDSISKQEKLHGLASKKKQSLDQKIITLESTIKNIKLGAKKKTPNSLNSLIYKISDFTQLNFSRLDLTISKISANLTAKKVRKLSKGLTIAMNPLGLNLRDSQWANNVEKGSYTPYELRTMQEILKKVNDTDYTGGFKSPKETKANFYERKMAAIHRAIDQSNFKNNKNVKNFLKACEASLQMHDALSIEAVMNTFLIDAKINSQNKFSEKEIDSVKSFIKNIINFHKPKRSKWQTANQFKTIKMKIIDNVINDGTGTFQITKSLTPSKLQALRKACEASLKTHGFVDEKAVVEILNGTND
jgi:hypothetical protein